MDEDELGWTGIEERWMVGDDDDWELRMGMG